MSRSLSLAAHRGAPPAAEDVDWALPLRDVPSGVVVVLVVGPARTFHQSRPSFPSVTSFIPTECPISSRRSERIQQHRHLNDARCCTPPQPHRNLQAQRHTTLPRQNPDDVRYPRAGRRAHGRVGAGARGTPASRRYTLPRYSTGSGRGKGREGGWGGLGFRVAHRSSKNSCQPSGRCSGATA